ncbi:hypothetical protein [Anoxynatronum buryatiense]|uniref:Uncharacterized protein n=1 Tax=Anoxynatronum buryatiense TaxID=489973 RepID=A0AA45WUT7_9CLOT|nr:hypothetical protein [Anoxynatronum buryatiense]SMP48139.1 hypothetical protein SAMN06296020_103214 [Anoxynatronum buryatiense]
MRKRHQSKQRHLQQIARILVLITILTVPCSIVFHHLYQREVQLQQRRIRLEEMRMTLIEMEIERNELLAQINDVYQAARPVEHRSGIISGEVASLSTIKANR